MPPVRPNAVAIASRLLLFTLLWVVLSGGVAGSWLVGVPAIIAATAASVQMRSRKPGPGRVIPRPMALLRFTGFFIWQSTRGGLDVARRAMDPRLPIAPGFVELRLDVPAGLVRIFVVDVASLLPGTLSVELEGDLLRLHVLDTATDTEQALRAVERQARALFGLDEPAGVD
jgi:multicomponent Na+:H+ antiporter subunit E